MQSPRPVDGPCRGLKERVEDLVPDAEKEQDDDQRERRAEQPEKNQDHLVTSLYPRRTVGGHRTAGHAGALALVEAEVHALA